MNKCIKNMAVMIVFIQFPILIFGQEAVLSSGGTATGSGGISAYSIGIPVYETFSNANGSVAQGVQHAYSIESVGLADVSTPYSITVFPNPSADFIHLQIEGDGAEMLNYQLLDFNGRVLQFRKITDPIQPINLSDLAQAAYFLNVIDQRNRIVSSFKIIKKL
jgi:hypothetical protein